jgi:hypothetical protein
MRRLSVRAAATVVFCSLLAGGVSRAQEDVVGDITILTMAKTHDESCDVLDSKARADFRHAVHEWIRSLKEDEDAKARTQKAWDDTRGTAQHDCQQQQFLEAALWTFRDARGENPQGQFRFLMKGKNFELKCHVLSTDGLRAFYQAGLDWIGKSGANEAQKSAMTAEWQKANPSEDADCQKDTMLDFMATWVFRAKGGS